MLSNNKALLLVSALLLSVVVDSWMQNFNFLNRRDGDFVRIDQTRDRYGPGPLLLLYDLPAGIATDEVHDMVWDGMKDQDCKIVRIDSSDDSASILDSPTKDALEKMMKAPTITTIESKNDRQQDNNDSPILFFSGFVDKDMMAVYNIVSSEVYHETNGKVIPACAKAVPNAMSKPLRQVLQEIAGDHYEAVKIE